MSEACENFNTDIAQIDNLYDLLLREITNKATKKAYKELYNKSYLTDIKEKEEKFKKEKNRINLNTATLVNTNYWRIEGISGIYSIFYKNVSEVFGRDVAEFDIPKEIQETSSIEEVATVSEEVQEEEEAVEKIPFQIDGYDDEDIEDEDNDVSIFESDENSDEADAEEYNEDDEINSDKENMITTPNTLIGNIVSEINNGSDIDEEFDIFGEKYKDVDFTDTNVMVAKSKVEEEMNFSDTKLTRGSNKTQKENIFKEIGFEDEIPYDVEDNELQLFDDWKTAQRKNSNPIEDLDLTKETTKKSGGLFKKLRRENKKNNFSDDIW